jgi:hypothetical protein
MASSNPAPQMSSVSGVVNDSFHCLSRELNIFVASFLDYRELKSMQAALPAFTRDPYMCDSCSNLWKHLILAAWGSRGANQKTIMNEVVASFEESLFDEVGRAFTSAPVAGSVAVSGFLSTQAALDSEPAAGLPLLPLRKRVLAQRAFSCLPPSWPRTFCAELLSLSDRHKVSKVNCFDS